MLFACVLAPPAVAQTSFDFESGTQGFTATPVVGTLTWQRTTNRGLDPGHSPTNSFYFGDPGTFNYDTGLVEEAILDSPPLLVVAPALMTFNYFLQTEGFTGFDIAEVSVSSDGGASFLTMLDNQILGGLLDGTGAWETASVDMSGFVGLTVIIRFRFDTVDGFVNGFEGWYVDDVAGPFPGGSFPSNPFDFETGFQGFTGAGSASLSWQLTSNRGGDAGHSPFNSLYFGNPATFNYDTGLTESGTLDSPPITLGGAPQQLIFNYFLETEQTIGFDRAEVQISTDGGLSFITMLDNQILGGLLDGTGSWLPATIDIAALAGQTILVRFSFDTVDTFLNNFEGWYVDDVEIVSGEYLFDYESGSQAFIPANVLSTLSWVRTQNRGTDLGHSSFESFYFGDPIARNFDTGAPEGATLDSPSIMLGTAPQSLTLNYFLDTEQTVGFDVAEVSISSDGGASFATQLDNQSGGGLLDGTGVWQPGFIDLSPWAGTPIIIRFAFDSVDTIANDFEGFYVDDVTLVGATQAVVASLRARAEGGRTVVEWETASESATAGFYLRRFDDTAGTYVPINTELLPAMLNAPLAGRYRLVDEGAPSSGLVTYSLVEVETGGTEVVHGPYVVPVTVEPPALDPIPLQNGGFGRAAQKPGPARSRRVSERARLRMASHARRRGNGRAKIKIRDAGLYYVSAEALADPLGMPSQAVRGLVRARRLALERRGESVAWLPAPKASGIYFHAAFADSIYSNEDVYWLGPGRGLEMETVYGAPMYPAGPELTFMETTQHETDRLAGVVLPVDPGSDYWFWDFLSAGSAFDRRSFPVLVTGVSQSASGPADLRVRLHGATRSGVSGEHRALVKLNGQTLGETSWEGLTRQEAVFSVDSGLLRDGDNEIEIQALLDYGVPHSIFYVDSFELRYRRSYETSEPSFYFSSERHAEVTVRGFTEPATTILELSDPLRPRVIEGAVATRDSSRYQFSFRPPSSETTYLAVASAGVRSPVSVVGDVSSHLLDETNRADYLVLAPAELEFGAERLASYRRGDGLTTMVVDLEDVMDEFNYGVFTPLAIRDFLTHAHERWEMAPRYVVLVGAGTFDYKNHLGAGDNLLPALMISTPSGLFPSDNRFADVSGDDGVPEMAIGRIPVLTNDELYAYVDKLVAYEESGGQSWTQNVLMLADDRDEAGDFPAASDRLVSLLPGDRNVQRIYLSQLLPDAARQSLAEALSRGAGFVNYVGHAGLDRLAAENLLNSSDLEQLDNVGRTPLVFGQTCLMNRFGLPGYETLGEALVARGSAGATAVWAPSGLSLNPNAALLAESFFRRAFGAREALLGDVILASLAEYAERRRADSLVELYTLLGDPAARIH